MHNAIICTFEEILFTKFNFTFIKGDNEDKKCEILGNGNFTEINNNDIIECIFRYAIPGGFLQLSSCYLQLMIIVGLCLDFGKSWTGQFFRTRIMQFLGRISMALYLIILIHELLIYWLKFIIYGSAEWKDGKNPGLTLPAWGIPIHLVISLIFGVLLTLYVEEPARKLLKRLLSKRKEKIEAEQQNTEKA